MKTLLRRGMAITVIATLMLSGMGYAFGVEPYVRVRYKGEKEFALFLNGLENNVQVSIKDINGWVLYKEYLKNVSGYSKKYDLKALPEGSYSIEIEDAQLIKSIPVRIDGNEVIVDEAEATNIYKPFFKQTNNVVDINLLSLTDADVLISIYDQNGSLIFDEAVKQDRVMHRRYNLSELKKGIYEITLNYNGRSFIKKVDID